MLKKNSVIVFQGDSVTDCGRTNGTDPSTALGGGYAAMTAKCLTELYKSYDLKFINRGVSGNTTADMEKRINTECINFKPSIVSILIGVNDVWREVDLTAKIDFDALYKNYESAFKKVKESGAYLIVLEPFALPCGVVNEEFFPLLGKLHRIVRKLADKYADKYIALDGLFTELSLNNNQKLYAEDGVHPTEKGHRVITEQLMKAIAGWR